MGRLTRDPDVRYTQGSEPMAIARYTLAVDRKYKRDGEQSADFISCVSFGRTAEFAEKYFHQGIKITISGRIQTGSYTNREGRKIYTTDVVVEEQEFAESKAASERHQEEQSGDAGAPVPPMPPENAPGPDEDGFMDIPDGIDEELPFN